MAKNPIELVVLLGAVANILNLVQVRSGRHCGFGVGENTSYSPTVWPITVGYALFNTAVCSDSIDGRDYLHLNVQYCIRKCHNGIHKAKALGYYIVQALRIAANFLTDYLSR